MSTKNVFDFFRHAARDEELKEKLNTVSDPKDLSALGQEHGFEFSPEHVDEALTEVKEQPGFFGKLMEAFLEIFSPSHDDYPEIGVEPYSGDPNKS